MSCSGCRVLRKGCSESCVLRNSISFLDTSEAQGYATLFVAKFFGRAGMISSLSSVPQSQRPALFRSLLYEACGRTVNPVTGSVGLLWSGRWDTCEAAVETVLRGGVPTPVDCGGGGGGGCGFGDGLYRLDNVNYIVKGERSDLDLSLQSKPNPRKTKREGTPYSDESEMTSEESISCAADHFRFKKQPRLLNLFV